METLKYIIGIMAFGSVGFSIINVYLTVNKLWKRKHLKVVAESISIVGRFIAITAGTLMTLDFFLHSQWLGVADRSVYIVASVVQIMIGAGFWVQGKKKKKIWILIKEALQLETKESAELAKSIFRPSHAEKIIDILAEVAMIDHVLDNREQQFIQNFADSWNIDLKWDELKIKMNSAEFSFDSLRNDMEEYLRTSPPPDQASQLGDLITMLVNVDNDISEEEELMLAELTGLIGNYVHKDALQSLFNVAIIPQSTEQDIYLEKTLAEAKKGLFAGGRAYFMGPYYSEKYAEIICQKYRSNEYLSIPVELNVAVASTKELVKA
jgi:AAA+ ATPase superfamily predicted ATPase